MVVTNDPTNDLVREMYAQFGLAYYNSEVLHRGLCIILAMSDLQRKDLMTSPRIEEHLARAFSLTLGNVIIELAGKLPPQYSTRLDVVLEKRNFLAHHFWFDRAHLMFKVDQIQELIDELDGYTNLFSRLNEEISMWFHSQQIELGLTDDLLNDCLTHILAGKGKKPLPGKDVVRQINKKLKCKQRLVRVWEFKLPAGGKPLVFELQDGSLWQLCDAGLGWTHFRQSEAHWVEHPAVQPHLPSNIIPRPKYAKAWEYEFSLKDSTVLWVKPGRHPQTFQWGIRTKNKCEN